jgi:peroxiredoxin
MNIAGKIKLAVVAAAVLAGAVIYAVEGPPKAPGFTLKNYDGKEVKLSDYKGKIIVLEWFNYECPFCRYNYEKTSAVKDLAAGYKDKGVVWLAINSTGHQTVEKNREFAEQFKVNFPILNDSAGAVGKEYDAKTTPHIFIINAKGEIVYNGALDNAPLGKTPKDETLVNYVDKALGELTAGKAVSTTTTKPYGCTVKYGK